MTAPAIVQPEADLSQGSQGSFTGASKSPKVSQPLISKIIKILEDRENVVLFDRGKKGVTLIPAGKLFFESCDRVFREIEGFKQSVARASEVCEGPLPIGASDNVCNYLLPGLINTFWLKYPRVSFNLLNGTAESIAQEIHRSRMELGFFYSRLKDPALEVKEIGFVEFVIVCSSRNHLLARKGFSRARLESAYFIGSRVADYSQPYPALTMLKSLGVRPRFFFETNSQETQKRIVCEELGYSVLPEFMVRKEAREGVLHVISTPKRIGMPLLLVTRRGRILTKPEEVFARHCKEELSRLLGS